MLFSRTAVPSLLSGGSLSGPVQQQLLAALAHPGSLSSGSALHAALGAPSSRPLALAPDWQVRSRVVHTWACQTQRWWHLAARTLQWRELVASPGRCRWKALVDDDSASSLWSLSVWLRSQQPARAI